MKAWGPGTERSCSVFCDWINFCLFIGRVFEFWICFKSVIMSCLPMIDRVWLFVCLVFPGFVQMMLLPVSRVQIRLKRAGENQEKTRSLSPCSSKGCFLSWRAAVFWWFQQCCSQPSAALLVLRQLSAPGIYYLTKLATSLNWEGVLEVGIYPLFLTGQLTAVNPGLVGAAGIRTWITSHQFMKKNVGCSCWSSCSLWFFFI